MKTYYIRAYLYPAERETLKALEEALTTATGTADELKKAVKRLEGRARKRRERARADG